jgi:hypothetical protein
MDSTIIIEKVSLLLQFCANNVDGHVSLHGQSEKLPLGFKIVDQIELVLSDCFNRLPMV